jgi:DNA-binding response OmpR family regulator
MNEDAAAPARILVVEDDETVADVVTRYLEREGFEVETVGDGSQALARALRSRPDLLVLDLMLPGLDGLEVCRRLRQAWPVSIVMLTARGDEEDRVMGLDMGADDYVAKPFSPRELTSRVKSVLRRSRSLSMPGWADGSSVVSVGELELDLAGREVKREGMPVSLTVREFELMAFLMTHRGQVFSREQLLEYVWGYRIGETSTVTVHVRRVREKIERDPSQPDHIQTVWGVGYRFVP